ncbi:MAG: PAS domain S-box protein [Vicinamibacterales bacterium]
MGVRDFDPANASDRMLAAIVESSDDAIIGKTLEGVIVTWNAAAERLYGYRADEVQGRSIDLLVPPSQSDQLRGILQSVSEGRRIDHLETIRRAKDGRLLDIVLTVSPIRDLTGHVIGAATIARDLTERNRREKALLASEARWRSVIESAVDAIILIDSRGCVEAFNSSAERLFGYREAEIVGQNVSCLMPQPDRDRHDGYLERYLRTGEQQIIGVGREVVAMRRNGTTFPAQLSVGEMVVNGERKFTGIVHDLTSRVRIEAQLREQTTMARLGEMAAVVAHEVKNPLAGIRGAVQVLGSRMAPESKEASVAHQIVARIDGLNDFVNDLLLLSRPATPHPTRLDLADVVTSTVAIFAQDQSMSGVHIETGGSAPPVMADAELLKIVIANLIVNGAQAMERRGSVHVTLRGDGNYAELIVRDAGPGIPAAARANLFTPFYTTKSRGTGLGLATAKRLVEAHHGSIELTCPEDGGTMVTIRLPIAP